jgi:hypothetical protein
LAVDTSNGQADEWSRVVTTTIKANGTGVWIGALSEMALWLVADRMLRVIDRGTGAVTAAHSLPSPVDVAASWQKRLEQGLFDAFSVSAALRETAVILPGSGVNGGSLQYVCPSISGLQSKELCRFDHHGWITLAGEAGTLAVGLGGKVLFFADGQTVGTPIDLAGLADIPPVAAPGWLCIMSTDQSAGALVANQSTQIVFFDRPGPGGAPYTRSLHWPLPGTPARGLPPLLIGDTLVLATRIAAEHDHRFQVVTIAELTEEETH